jgi:riboflavin kinase/FMN adenylyltransferase
VIITHSLPPLDATIKTAVTIGTFDGVHLGHTQIIKQLVQRAEMLEIPSVVLSFYPHPRIILHQDSGIKLLDTLEEKAAKLEALGVDYFVVYPFSRSFSRMKAEAFVSDILVKGLHAKSVLIGYDHRFGRNRNANIEDLRNYGKQYDFEVAEISAQAIEAVAISSTKIRKALAQGQVKKANQFLGSAFSLCGKVVSGKQIGRTLGFPTANIKPTYTYKLIPKEGVYVIKSQLDGQDVFGMLNIGQNPTVSLQASESLFPKIEAHFFNFNKDLYEQEINVSLMDRLRDEIKFESLEALALQLKKDQSNALKIVAAYKSKK